MKIQRETLLNGADVIGRYNCENGGWLVLCQWRDQFVTWNCDSEGNAYWGHYYIIYDHAKADWIKRIEQVNASTIENLAGCG